MNTVSVSALNAYVKGKLESDENLRSVLVEGEISNFSSRSASGHLYFTLKDEQAAINAAMWRSSAVRLRFRPDNGMKVVVRAMVTIYEKSGNYQLIVSAMQPAGLGEQERQLRELQEKLRAEGLFDESRKRPLPILPKTIAVITSRDGAALQDIKNVITRRWPLVKILLCHTAVQGIFAEDEIVSAIKLASGTGADLAIISRGGGSTEDLFVFNSEKIVRAAATMPMPFISAVGHEVDTTLIDFVSDKRAPTPSAAAEIAVPDRAAVLSKLEANRDYFESRVRSLIEAGEHDLMLKTDETAESEILFLKEKGDLIAGLKDSLQSTMEAMLLEGERRLKSLAAVTDSVSPLQVLARGYSRISKDGKSVTSAKELQPGDEFCVSFRDGDVAGVVRG